ncbi:MAG TPA: BMP family ABC transporter substrate-binding protein [Bacilli bacterium]|jgi:basic membrane protein A|nr:BMP family ABC transporter substrate-binding protein [Bacilli bacterium]HOH58916.1 BMP family ABC transporter substrate-binding protein [Bacilli bacterium]HPA98907.1 BMP family ABC transporter substrate-binding protein [Bacilli bacterium]HPX82868.1 BMP family ABC transporter substrate-binding protein [Bacilli bacterium]HQB79640.1 BMP family ABC transporter substrate-binding protein [Bacilli bacterium]
MKKFIAFLVLVLGLGLLVGCSCEDKKEEKTKIVMITDVGTINDKSFNQGTWEGVKAFGGKHADKVEYQYYQPANQATADYVAAIELNIEEGAKVIVTPGFYFSDAIGEMAVKYPDVSFIFIDGVPTNKGAAMDIPANVCSILFKEEEAGFTAGYAAVKDGFTNLGFLGGAPVPAVVKFGIGYIAGAYYAANEMSKEITFPANRYEYLNDFAPNPNHTTKAASWYDAGTEIIFACAGGAGNSVFVAAEGKEGKWVIGVDVDQEAQSAKVISSSMKLLGEAVEQELKALIVDKAFSGGKALSKGVHQDAVGLPTAPNSWRWRTFTTAQYEELLTLMKADGFAAPTTKVELAAFLNDKCGNPAGVAALIDVTQPDSE